MTRTDTSADATPLPHQSDPGGGTEPAGEVPRRRLRIFLADDHAVLRAGLRLLINSQPDMAVVGEAADGQETIERVSDLASAGDVDVVVLDIGMPRLNGLEALRRIKADFPDLAVLILTMHASEPYLFQVIQAGGAGYVLKQTADEHLLGAIRDAARGMPFLYPTMEARLLTDYVHRARRAGERAATAYLSLTEREREVLSLVAQGYTNQEIADRLVVSVKTVETHRAHIMTKLGLKTRAELVHYALREGYLTSEAAME
ncbi:MAG: response regulator transcription factor [Chloroflexi bacterium]|nr:response regulator transcription factor [Chloroflexota bacterium]